jgi:hypothetical protein
MCYVLWFGPFLIKLINLISALLLNRNIGGDSMITIQISGSSEDIQRTKQRLRSFLDLLAAHDLIPNGNFTRQTFDANFVPEAWIDWECPLCGKVFQDVDKVAHLMLQHNAKRESCSPTHLQAGCANAGYVEQLEILVSVLEQFYQREVRSEEQYEEVRRLVRLAQKALFEAAVLYVEER